MGYLRQREEELTGYQEIKPLSSSIDLQCDFVMVYGIDDTMPSRIKQYKDVGYKVHLMTGISWGNYQDYLSGNFDGVTHYDEAQMDRNNKEIIHNPTIPYIVPSIAFSNYLIENLKVAVDNHVDAIHMEEPEFWNDGGYSEAFKREYEIYYHEKWVGQHTDVTAHYKTAKLKAELFARTIRRISESLKEYAKVKYNYDLRFYIPTHSLVNYTQWKIISPESLLTEIPTVDGYIAQIWTGTSRCANIYNGIYKERTFETSFLEYGIMQELVRSTGRRMWFLNDPIEDALGHTWEDYEYNYKKTAVASLLHPDIYHYEICPWPDRVFNGIYPKIQPNIKVKDETAYNAPDSKPIPKSYATLLSSIFQLFGDMKQDDFSYDGFNSKIGIFISDTSLYQRSLPDNILKTKPFENDLTELLNKYDKNSDEFKNEFSKLLYKVEIEKEYMLDFNVATAFPQFFGLALPLLKHGLPIIPIQLENCSRYTDYLDGYNNLILSYEFIKPNSPSINVAISSWVQNGGTLFYVGDDSDVFNNIDEWWKKSGFNTPREHLFNLLGLDKNTDNGEYNYGKGKIVVYNFAPYKIGLSKENGDYYRNLIKNNLNNIKWNETNSITLRRGPYIISSVMDESISNAPKVFTGVFADMLTTDYEIIEKQELYPDSTGILFDFDKIKNNSTSIIGTSARILSFICDTKQFNLSANSADNIDINIRIKLPKMPKEVTGKNLNVNQNPITFKWDSKSQTVLLSYKSTNQVINISGIF